MSSSNSRRRSNLLTTGFGHPASGIIIIIIQIYLSFLKYKHIIRYINSIRQEETGHTPPENS